MENRIGEPENNTFLHELSEKGEFLCVDCNTVQKLSLSDMRARGRICCKCVEKELFSVGMTAKINKKGE